jgi:hypothetical protein
VNPYNETDDDHYSQLFPHWNDAPTSGPELAEIVTAFGNVVAKMIDDGSGVCDDGPERIVDAGYTYFGQFLDHNLTNDQTSIGDVWTYKLRPCDIMNTRKPRLDLGQLYGRGPWDEVDKRLYDDKDVSLKVGPKKQSAIDPAHSPKSFDVAVDNDGPLVADKRSCENVILRQITAVFARLHNQAVRQFRKDAGTLRELFDRARLWTTWQFQRVVCTDYLQKLLHPDVYDSLFGDSPSPACVWKSFSVPAEFSAAAMRFGHSMVQDSYQLSLNFHTGLLEILNEGRRKQNLLETWEIDWGRFFANASANPGSPQTARPIDTRIAPSLHHIPQATLLLFNTGVTGVPPGIIPIPQLPLPAITLVRGLGLKLATGQTAARAFGHKILTNELSRDCHGKVTDQGAILGKWHDRGETPLWYYVLKESELHPLYGGCLGETGSSIVGETVYAALANDPLSFWNHPDPAAKEFPMWNLPQGKRQLFSLNSLFGAATELE